MQAEPNPLDVANSSAEDFLRMHGYWLQAPLVGQDSVPNSDDITSSTTTPLHKENSGSAHPLGPYYFPESVLSPPNRGPLVEDDEESDQDEGGAIAFEYYLQRSVSGHTPPPLPPAPTVYAPAQRAYSSGEASPGTASDDDGVPVLEEESLGDLDKVIGYGGDRGSFVCRVAFPALLQVLQQRAPSYASPWTLSTSPERDQEAYKRYPVHISPDELSFVATAYRCAGDSAHCQSAHSPFLTSEEAQYAALHLVLPDAIVTRDGHKVGLLMPLYNCSLKEFLQSLKPDALSGSHSSRLSRPPSNYPHDNSFAEDSSGGGGGGAFNSAVKYSPVDSMRAIGAIAFQVLEAIAYLNHRLPHGDGFTGYTHNDLHLDNVLLSYEGDVALCDFELVASTPQASHSCAIRRLPPSSRQSPYGLFTETADTWAFGLMLVGLLTGVDPLFTASIVNDFSDGPQLSRWDGEKCVLDWEDNIKAHVEGLLRRQDPTGRRLSEAQSILQLCGKCLVNDGRATPPRAVDLLEEPLFRTYRSDFRQATKYIREWIATKPR